MKTGTMEPSRSPQGLRDGRAARVAQPSRPPARRWRGPALLLAAWVATAAVPATSWSDAAPEVAAPPAAAGESAPLYMAVPLDQDGKLADALPLYRAQAETTLTKADRLRYAGALMRAGRADEAHAIYDQVSQEVGSVEHGGGGAARGPAICASSLLASGFPELAVPYARQARRLRTNDPTLALLLVRALAASGDATAARSSLRDAARRQDGWVIGQRVELARWQLLIGDAAAARRSLGGDLMESVAQMFRDSILANLPFKSGDWKAAAEMLAASERKVPSGLSDTRVDRAWRNTQRELWWVQLRRAISLWKAGSGDLAASEAAKAQRSDEEYVRSAATLLLVATDLAHGQPSAARARLHALEGHDVRFADAVVALEAGRGAAADQHALAPQLRATLGQLDRSADFVTQPLCAIVAEAAQAGASEAVREAAR